MSSSPTEPGGRTYVGLFLTTLSLLQLELFLTRIFSVTMWYHFAFMAISLAMFGLAAGAVLVEVMRKRDPHQHTGQFRPVVRSEQRHLFHSSVVHSCGS